MKLREYRTWFLCLVLAVLGVPQVVFAGQNNAFDSITEYGLSCDAGGCIDNLNYIPSQQHVRLQKVDIYGPEGQDTRVMQIRTDSGKGFAPIGVIVPNNPISAKTVSMVDGKPVVSWTKTQDAQATATLVSPCLILTNYHAVYGDRGGSDEETGDHSATFFVGASTDPDAFEYQVKATPIDHGTYVDGGSDAQDWALLQLDSNSCIGANSDLGWMDLTTAPLEHEGLTQLKLAGYPVDHDSTKLWISPSCNIRAMYSIGVAAHDCASSPGDSGGMAVKQNADGSLTALFMNSGFFDGSRTTYDGYSTQYHAAWSANQTGLGVDLSVLMRSPRVGGRIRADIAAWNIKNPSHPNVSNSNTQEATIGAQPLTNSSWAQSL